MSGNLIEILKNLVDEYAKGNVSEDSLKRTVLEEIKKLLEEVNK